MGGWPSRPPLDPEAAGGAGAPDRDEVVMQAELLSDNAMRSILRCVSAAAAIGVAVAVLMVYALAADFFKTVRGARPLMIANAAEASIELAVLGCVLGMWAWRGVMVRTRGMAWSRRRRRLSCLVAFEGLLLLVASVFFLAPNVHALTRTCGFFDGFVKWSAGVRFLCWATLYASFVVRVRMANLWVDGGGRRPAEGLILDAPWGRHAPVALYWAALVALGLAGLGGGDGVDERGGGEAGEACEEEVRECAFGDRDWVLKVSTSGMSWGYFMFLVVYAGRGARQLHRKSYSAFRWVFSLFRYQCHTIGLVFTLSLASETALAFARYDSCTAYAATTLGGLSNQLMVGILGVLNVLLFMPTAASGKAGKSSIFGPKEDSPLIWSERGCFDSGSGQGVAISEERASPTKGRTISSGTTEPSFCFETAVKLFYWSVFAYMYDPQTGVSDSSAVPFRKEVAIGLYNIENLEFIDSKVMDMRCFVGWNRQVVVVAVRGTKTARNWASNMHAARLRHPSARSAPQWPGGRPMVHAGFLHCWTRDGFRDSILKLVKDVTSDSEKMVLVTGHSLGAAVAILAAYDIHKVCGVPRERVVCYGYGAPRVGDHAFAAELDSVLPNCWLVMNDMDRIVTVPKFWFLYKHPHNKVIINPEGQLIVRPLMSENRLLSMGRRLTTADHELLSYRDSLAAVAKSQVVKGTGLSGGAEGVLEVFGNGQVGEALGLDRRELLELGRMGSSVWEAEREKKKREFAEHVERCLAPLAALMACCRDSSSGTASEQGFPDDSTIVEIVDASTQVTVHGNWGSGSAVSGVGLDGKGPPPR